MSLKRHAAKRDSNEAEIVTALRGVGALVLKISEKSAPDLVVLFRSSVFALEVKTAKGKLTKDQKELHAACEGAIQIVRTVDEALRAIGAVEGDE